MNKLLLSKEDPEIAEALKGCKVGDRKTLEVDVEVTRDDPKMFEADVVGLTYAEDSEPETEPAETETETAETETEPVAMSSRGPQTAKLKY